MTYAAGTSVSVEKSKAALDALLRKHGAGQRVFGDDDVNGKAYVVFALAGRQYRLEVPLPKAQEFAKKPRRGWGMVARTADGAGSWVANGWVWRIAFKRVEVPRG